MIPRILYFDIDGTLLLAENDQIKARLGDGRFEMAVREAGFTQLVCVSNLCSIIHIVKEMKIEFDEFSAMMEVCRGAFVDEPWFRSIASYVTTPENRAAHIDFSGDWWYVDDLAQEYLQQANRGDVLAAHQGRRVFIPQSMGDGQDVLDWLASISGR